LDLVRQKSINISSNIGDTYVKNTPGLGVVVSPALQGRYAMVAKKKQFTKAKTRDLCPNVAEQGGGTR
jgi:hypothetical protein